MLPAGRSWAIDGSYRALGLTASRAPTAGRPARRAPASPAQANLDVLGEGRQKAIIAGYVIENPGEELRIVGGGANRFRAEPRQRQEAPEPLGFARQVAKCLNCQLFCRLSVDSINLGHGLIFPIP